MVALTFKKMKMSLSVLIVAWGSIRKVGIRSIVNNCLSNDMKKNGKFEHCLNLIEVHVVIGEAINLTSAFGAEQPRWVKT